MFGEKFTFGGANPQTEFFWWDGNFWILDGSSKLWCFEWNGILSIPQVWRKLSPHEEHITHMSTLKTSTEKLRNWNGINSQPNGVNFQPNGVNFQPNGVNYFGCFQCIFGLWHATYLPMFPRVCDIKKVQNMCKNGSWPGKNLLQTVETEVFGWEGRNFWSDNNFLNLGWAGGKKLPSRQA